VLYDEAVNSDGCKPETTKIQGSICNKGI